MDFSALKALNLTANILTKGVQVRDIKTGEATLRAKIDRGRLSADIIGASLYGGKGDVSISIDANTAVVEKRGTLKGVQIEPLLKAAQGKDYLSGTANLDFNLVTRGLSEYELVSNLQGIGKFSVADGAVKGLNIAEMIRNVQSAFRAVENGAQKTDFTELNGSFTIAGGILKNSDLAMKAPLLRLAGNGQVDLPAYTINYRLTPEIVATKQGQGGKDKQGFGVPILVTGSLDNPSFAPDLQSAITEAIKDPQKIQDTVKDVTSQFKGQNKKDALKNLRGLFKGN